MNKHLNHLTILYNIAYCVRCVYIIQSFINNIEYIEIIHILRGHKSNTLEDACGPSVGVSECQAHDLMMLTNILLLLFLFLFR